MDFDLSLDSHPPDTHVTVRGELDLATSPLMSERLRAEIAAGCRQMTIDLSEVSFVDASALGVLTLTRRALRERHGSLTVTGYRPTFLRLCHATGLAELFGLPGPDGFVPPV